MSGKRVAKRSNPQALMIILILVLSGAIAAVLGLRGFFDKPEIPPEQPGTETPGSQTSGTQDPAGSNTPGQSGSDVSGSETPNEPVRTNIRKEDCYIILLSGVDKGNGGADTNILVSFDAKNGTINCVSIPRDSAFYINGESHKINYAYNKGGMKLLASSISEGLGIPVDYTVKVDLTGFVKLVDAIGGVEFDVPIDMDYDDPYQNLSIHIAKGLQKLDGQNALNVVRFRHNNDGSGYRNQDLGRISTQQAFLKAVAKQTLQLSNLDKVSELVKIFNKYVDTSLSLGNLAWLGKEAINIGTENIAFSTLPGAWSSSQSLYLLDQNAVLDLVNTTLNPYQEDRISSDLHLVAG